MYWFAEVHSAVLPFTYAVSMQALGFAPGRLFPFTTYSVDWSRLSETAVGYHAVGISPVSCAAKAPPAAESTPVVREITATEFVFAFVTYSVRSLEEMARLFGLAPRSFSGLEKRSPAQWSESRPGRGWIVCRSWQRNPHCRVLQTAGSAHCSESACSAGRAGEFFR